MSLLSSLLQQLIGTDTEETVVQRPCANCPSDCVIAKQGACPECEPFKKKLIDEIYHVNHLEEYYDRFEVTGTTAQSSGSASGIVICPVCRARSANPYVCEYCDTPLADAPASSGKIKVEKASDIPNPIMNAQDIIFERYETVTKKYSSSGESRSLLGDLFDALTGGDDDEDSSLVAKMSEAEIKEAAELYKMSVGDYLTGLDNGICLTLKGKKAADQQAQFSSAASEPASFGLPGIAALGLLGSALVHQTEIPSHYYKPPVSIFQIGNSQQFPHHNNSQGLQQFPHHNNPQGLQQFPHNNNPQGLQQFSAHNSPQGLQQLFSTPKPQSNWLFRSGPEESEQSDRPTPDSKDQPGPDKNAEHRAKDQPRPDKNAEHRAKGNPRPDKNAEHSPKDHPRREKI